MRGAWKRLDNRSVHRGAVSGPLQTKNKATHLVGLLVASKLIKTVYGLETETVQKAV